MEAKLREHLSGWHFGPKLDLNLGTVILKPWLHFSLKIFDYSFASQSNLFLKATAANFCFPKTSWAKIPALPAFYQEVMEGGKEGKEPSRGEEGAQESLYRDFLGHCLIGGLLAGLRFKSFLTSQAVLILNPIVCEDSRHWTWNPKNPASST